MSHDPRESLSPFIEPVFEDDPRWAGCWCWGKGDADHNTYRVPDDTPRYDTILRYMSLKQVAFLPYTRRLNHRSFHIESAWCIAHHSIEQLEPDAEHGDAGSMLELALRVATACEVKGDALRCVELLETILGRRASKTAHNVTLDIRRRALSMLSQAHMDKHNLKPFEVRATAIGYYRDSDLLLAARDADAAIAAGLVSEATLEVARHLVVAAMHEDVRSSPKTDRRFGKYKALWGAYAEFMVTLKKVKLAPQRYECAAPGCEVIRLRGKDLRRCGGACPPEFKPSYCSTACQQRDWQRHKAVCCDGETPAENRDRYSEAIRGLCSKGTLGADVALHTYNTRTGYCPIMLDD